MLQNALAALSELIFVRSQINHCVSPDVSLTSLTKNGQAACFVQ
jgi:hypothetical protein